VRKNEKEKDVCGAPGRTLQEIEVQSHRGSEVPNRSGNFDNFRLFSKK